MATPARKCGRSRFLAVRHLHRRHPTRSSRLPRQRVSHPQHRQAQRRQHKVAVVADAEADAPVVVARAAVPAVRVVVAPVVADLREVDVAVDRLLHSEA